MIYAVSLAFGKVKTIKASIQRFDETIGLRKEDYKHILIDQMWPKDREELTQFLSEQEEKGKIVLKPGKNLGLAGGVNHAIAKMGANETDTIIIYDPDNFPIQKRWGYAFKKVLEDDSIGWVSLWNHATNEEIKHKPYTNKSINGYGVCIVHSPVMNSVCALKMSYLSKLGGAKEPNHFYGGFEIGMWSGLKSLNLDWAFLIDFHEDNIMNVDPDFIDKDYQEYKWATTHGKEEQIEFTEWLKKHGRI